MSWGLFLAPMPFCLFSLIEKKKKQKREFKEGIENPRFSIPYEEGYWIPSRECSRGLKVNAWNCSFEFMPDQKQSSCCVMVDWPKSCKGFGDFPSLTENTALNCTEQKKRFRCESWFGWVELGTSLHSSMNWWKDVIDFERLLNYIC